MNPVQNFWLDHDWTKPKAKEHCCGCSACQQSCSVNAIEMRYDKEGFLYPVVSTDKCINCGLCVKVCPVSNNCQTQDPFIKTFAGFSSDKAIIQNATSGGIASSLSRMVIDAGGVVYGVAYRQDITHSYYMEATKPADLLSIAGSKYMQSEKDDVFIKVRTKLKKGVQVLFIGCPCDVSALKRFLRQEYDNLLTCELVCMGVTSPKALKDYKEWTEKTNHAKLTKLIMRSKRKGWFVPQLEEFFEGGKIKATTLSATYFGHVYKLYNRPSCFHCQYRGTTGVGDIRVGDFWGVKKTDEFWNPDGVSVIFVRTKKGLYYLQQLYKYNFHLFETDYQLAIGSNMSAYKNKSQKYIALRDKFADIYIKQDKGLIEACKRTAGFDFWLRRFLPEAFHERLKDLYHMFVDAKRTSHYNESL